MENGGSRQTQGDNQSSEQTGSVPSSHIGARRSSLVGLLQHQRKDSACGLREQAVQHVVLLRAVDCLQGWQGPKGAQRPVPAVRVERPLSVQSSDLRRNAWQRLKRAETGRSRGHDEPLRPI